MIVQKFSTKYINHLYLSSLDPRGFTKKNPHKHHTKHSSHTYIYDIQFNHLCFAYGSEFQLIGLPNQFRRQRRI